jgi:Peptidase family S41
MNARLGGFALALLIGAIAAAGLRELQLDDAAAKAAAAEHWSALTKIDVDAAYELLKNNHPGATPEAGDAEFRSTLDAGHARGLERAAKVTNFDGYVATLGEFANGMGDGHIGSRTLYPPQAVQWAGIVAAKQGENWVVASDDAKTAGAELTGARIVSCDGKPAESLARETLRFRTVVSVAALEVLQGGWLLVDEGNPFVARPRECVFEQAGQSKTLTLNWTRISRNTLLTQRWKNPYGQAGYGVRKSGEGFWIAIQQLSPPAQAVIDAVKAQSSEIRAAPYAVVDLRGNGGGDDAYARALAEELYGVDDVNAALGPKADDAGGCDSVFRASPQNIEAIAKGAELFQQRGDTEGAREYTNAAKAMREAAAQGKPLSGSMTCKTKTGGATRNANSLMRGKVFVLTDSVCFSSCIQAVEFLRKLGATQVGLETGADTHYSEVRQITLPSGLSVFSTLQAIMPDYPKKIGPYSPEHEYEGDIADTAALEKWIEANAGNF